MVYGRNLRRLLNWDVALNYTSNPFGYQPWRDQKTFAAMFDILETDIVVFQETKIQRKDLSDDMVLVPGWDCYWSLPKHKKGTDDADFGFGLPLMSERILGRRHLHKAIEVRSHSCRRRHHWSALSPEFIHKLCRSA